MANLTATYGNFLLRGVVSGLKGEKTFTEGKSSSEWKKVQFTVNTNKNSRHYVELMGTKNKEVKFFKNEKDKPKEEKNVPWADRYKERKDGFKIMMPIKVGLEKDPEDESKNLIKELTAFDAVDYIKKYLKDGDQVFILGSMQFSTYEGRTQIKYQIKNIYASNNDMDFNSDNFEEEASFNQEIVYRDYTDKDDKTIIHTYVIYKNKDFMDFVKQDFAIIPSRYKNDEDKYESLKVMAENFKGLSFGSTIKVNGNILSYVPTVTADSGTKGAWGFKAKGQEMGGRPIRELEITGAEGDSLKQDRYTEEDFVVQGSEFGNDQSEEGFNESLEDLPF